MLGPNRLPKSPAQAIAHDCAADPPADLVRHPGRIVGESRRDHGQREGTVPTAASSGECRKGGAIAHPPNQALRRARPFRRRAFRTDRPPWVRIRIRKPCVFLRFRLLGWNGRFTFGSPGHQCAVWPRAGRRGGASTWKASYKTVQRGGGVEVGTPCLARASGDGGSVRAHPLRPQRARSEERCVPASRDFSRPFPCRP